MACNGFLEKSSFACDNTFLPVVDSSYVFLSVAEQVISEKKDQLIHNPSGIDATTICSVMQNLQFLIGMGSALTGSEFSLNSYRDGISPHFSCLKSILLGGLLTEGWIIPSGVG